MKVFFRNIHLYLSLAAGLVILIACLTGAILVFEKELMEAFNKERYYVTAAGPAMPLDELVENVKRKMPKAKIGSVKVYSDASRSVEIGVSLPEKDGDKSKAGTD